MKNRYLPYGYKIEDGRCTVHSSEAEAVKEIFRLYSDGQSYQSIAQIMGRSSFPPYSESGWNKHHIKRILENERYIGTQDYPSIIGREQYRAAREILKDKTANITIKTDPSKILWECILCGKCGSRLLRNGSPAASKGILQLRCAGDGCGYATDISKNALYIVICALQNKMLDTLRDESAAAYEPSLEAKRLENQINRTIARPDDSTEAVRLILQGIAARYDSIPSPPAFITKYKDRLLEPDWELFREAVLYISLSHDKIGMNSITGEKFSMERKDMTCIQQQPR